MNNDNLVINDSKFLDNEVNKLINEINNINKDYPSISYESNTNIPSAEPLIYSDLFNTINSFLDTFKNELNNIVSVSDEYNNLDKYLSNKTNELNFDIKSNIEHICNVPDSKNINVEKYLSNNNVEIKEKERHEINISFDEENSEETEKTSVVPGVAASAIGLIASTAATSIGFNEYEKIEEGDEDE